MTHLFQTLFALSVTAGDRVAAHARDLKSRETGASAVEYALLVGTIALAVVAGLAIFGPKLTAAISNIRVN
ncbi:Flp family type IVb pilin [Klenkia sp. PcliD-1-E]|uniref:Flp family type IVb pilin n=1 Tax=Klenkia sp. PcliD-1-E TaxID=2954492 RepID=UPI00209788DD|nr:Flp family type IVb pilin [Klenkia sp. PcliD-1-E]MCO7219871.1 Flp family type IVb pilin [Klenkia sp. PcliD-1-E]